MLIAGPWQRPGPRRWLLLFGPSILTLAPFQMLAIHAEGEIAVELVPPILLLASVVMMLVTALAHRLVAIGQRQKWRFVGQKSLA